LLLDTLSILSESLTPWFPLVALVGGLDHDLDLVRHGSCESVVSQRASISDVTSTVAINGIASYIISTHGTSTRSFHEPWC